jgi:hypothetical protein
LSLATCSSRGDKPSLFSPSRTILKHRSYLNSSRLQKIVTHVAIRTRNESTFEPANLGFVSESSRLLDSAILKQLEPELPYLGCGYWYLLEYRLGMIPAEAWVMPLFPNRIPPNRPALIRGEPRTANCWRSGLRGPPPCCTSTCNFQKYPEAWTPRRPKLHPNPPVLAPRHPDTFENAST